MKSISIRIFSVIVSAGMLMSACQGITPQVETQEPEIIEHTALIAEGTFEPVQSVELAFGMSGTISHIWVVEGETVKANDPIARLAACGPIEADLANDQSNLLAAQQELANLTLYSGTDRAVAIQSLIDAQETFDEAQLDWDDFDNDGYQDDLGAAQEDVQEAQDDLDEAIQDLEEYLDLAEDNATRERYQDAVDDAERDLHIEQQDLNEIENDYLQALQEYELAAGQLDSAQAEYDRKLDGPDADQLALNQSRISALESAISGLEEQRSACLVTAPFNGDLLYNDLRIGEFVQVGNPVLMVADTAKWMLKTDDISEYEVVSIEEGQEVEVTADALPSASMSGKVQKIDRVATLDHGDVTYTVTITIEDAPPELRWGMTASVRFLPLK